MLEHLDRAGRLRRNGAGPRAVIGESRALLAAGEWVAARSEPGPADPAGVGAAGVRPGLAPPGAGARAGRGAEGVVAAATL